MKTIAAFSVLFLLAGAAAGAAQADDAPRRTLSLSATGEASARPDVAVISLGVVRRAPSAARALRANTEAMRKVFSALQTRWKIAERDMATSGFSITAEYFYPKNKPRRLTGYRVSNMLTVKVRDLDALGAILDDLVRSGSNSVNGVSFRIDKPEALREKARRAAVRKALAHARLYAEEAGFKLGPVLRMSESGGALPPPRPMLMRKAVMAEAAPAPVPLAAGERKVRVSVSITWEIE